jgi:hypothetical protein
MRERLDGERHEPQGSGFAPAGRDHHRQANQGDDHQAINPASDHRAPWPKLAAGATPGAPRQIGHVSQWRRPVGNIAGAGTPTSSIARRHVTCGTMRAPAARPPSLCVLRTFRAYRFGFSLHSLTVSTHVSKKPARIIRPATAAQIVHSPTQSAIDR